jgi:transcriptional regulator with XRE-family HTH domain
MHTSWEIEQAHLVGREIQRIRKDAGLTAQQLGDRTAELGLKMTRQAISDLENGRRRYVTASELAVLAYALNTSPAALTYAPQLADGRVELFPGMYVTAAQALAWFSGAGADLAANPDTYSVNNKPVALVRQLEELKATAKTYAESDADPATKAAWIESLSYAQKAVTDRMRELRMVLDTDTNT